MVLVSFKNIDFWPKNGAHAHIWAYAFFHNSAISGPIGLKFFMGVQDTIIYRLVMRNLSYNAYFSVLIFWATFGGKMGVATTRAPNGLGPPHPTKKLDHWMELLGQPLSRNHVFAIFIAVHCILSDFDPNFVTLNQVRSPNYQFYPILMMFWRVDQKETKKTTTMTTTTMRMENERIFQVFFENFQFLLELSKF